MLKNIFLLALIALLNRFYFKISYEDLFTHLVNYTNDYGAETFAYTLGCLIILALISFLFSHIGLFRIADLVGNFFLLTSQVGLLGLAILNIVFWFILEQKIYAATNYLPLALFLALLLGTCFSLRIVDFNFPLRHAILPSIVLTVVSVLFTGVLSFF